jgi:hypothetical protein
MTRAALRRQTRLFSEGFAGWIKASFGEPGHAVGRVGVNMAATTITPVRTGTFAGPIVAQTLGWYPAMDAFAALGRWGCGPCRVRGAVAG